MGIPIETRLSNSALQKRRDSARTAELRSRAVSEQIRRSVPQDLPPIGLQTPLYSINMADLQQAVDAAAATYNANIRN